tara:strand:+ start:206 stop:487 length:282 start_codon:yes stop_codon:yes gene_type:complete
MKKIYLLILFIVSSYSFSLTADEKAIKGMVIGDPKIDKYVICKAIRYGPLMKCVNAVVRLNLGFEIEPNWLKSNLELRFVDGATMLLLVKKDK